MKASLFGRLFVDCCFFNRFRFEAVTRVFGVFTRNFVKLERQILSGSCLVHLSIPIDLSA